jgi:hypothetical protein
MTCPRPNCARTDQDPSCRSEDGLPSDRTDFLREYYRLLTDDIRRSEGMIPGVCALQATFMIVLLAVRWGQGPLRLASLLVVLTSTYAIHVLIQANFRARRSHLMAANVELEFFTHGDMDVLLPKSYYSEARTYRYRRVFGAPLFLSAVFFAIGVTTLPFRADPMSWTLLIAIVLLLWFLYFEHRKYVQEYRYLIQHAPGRSSEQTPL